MCAEVPLVKMKLAYWPEVTPVKSRVAVGALESAAWALDSATSNASAVLSRSWFTKVISLTGKHRLCRLVAPRGERKIEDLTRR